MWKQNGINVAARSGERLKPHKQIQQVLGGCKVFEPKVRATLEVPLIAPESERIAATSSHYRKLVLPPSRGHCSKETK